jgi:UDP-N-acetylmuramoyl-tripeptide--D-alanyl-D-alanine ligase
MSTPGEIAPRSLMVRPHIAIITKIAAAHLEGLGSLEAIAAEKAGIFAGLERDGVCVLPHEDPFFDYLAAEARRCCARTRIVSFGLQGDVRILGYETDGVASRIEIDVMGERAHVAINAVGRHWASNVALALAVAKLAGIAPDAASADLSGYAPPSGRGVLETLQTSDGGTAFLVDDSYNANPESMRAALEAFALRPGTKIVCLGEMRELGPEALKLHAELAPAVLASQAAVAILAGDMMAPLEAALAGRPSGPQIIRVSAPAEAANALKSLLKNGDAVLIKGSNASGMGTVANSLRAWAGSLRQSQKASGMSDVV